MKKGLIVIIAFLSLTFNVSAQDIAQTFIAIPDSLLPYLETEWRKDLVELYKGGKEARLKNMIGDNSSLEKLTDDYLLLKVSEISTVEMKLLPLVNNTHIICVITTVKGPVEDSRVNFYTTAWEPLPADDLYTPVTKDWFIKENITPDDNAEFLLMRLDMDLVRYALDPEQAILTAYYMTPFYLAKQEREEVMVYLKEEPRVYTWNRSYFK